jgi:3-oxo-5-alpha-steroid 4-dehydrogenase 1
MELFAPASFIYAFLHSPLSSKNFGYSPSLSLSNPPTLLAGLFLIHYLNRALVSPLRTPSRSKSHLAVPLSGISFNVVNGSLMGAYLSSPVAASFLEGAFSRPLFWVGIGLWAFGFAGNILHDEILLNLRRSAKVKGKGRADGDDNNGKSKQEHYAIPYGYLYRYISYPNYLCEWLEWLGFAIAASPVPSLTSVAAFLETVTPPFLFFYSEVLLMIPRAYRGHKWYHSKFPDYPKERKAVIPLLF